ncbi:hypothetical protein [Nonomuraea africana]|uniref:Uncharacterized protein n=1 Tax=Nonomuraea africana TaxID=46171 RepID=A0ABR9K7E2_9ACTN|nr:hypothetical protein [Nonomuraea africana]MBE1557930.1 hypothetical protein [Nonomuraea africana]
MISAPSSGALSIMAGALRRGDDAYIPTRHVDAVVSGVAASPLAQGPASRKSRQIHASRLDVPGGTRPSSVMSPP